MMRLVNTALGVAFPIAVRGRRLYRLIMRPVTVGVRALVLHDDQVLLVRQHGDAEWVLPGGAANRGETLREAALREAHEETGVMIEAERLLGIFSTVYEHMTNHVAVFVCHPLHDISVQPRPRFNIEIAEVRWWPLHALPATLHPTARNWLSAHAAGATGLDGRI